MTSFWKGLLGLDGGRCSRLGFFGFFIFYFFFLAEKSRSGEPVVDPRSHTKIHSVC